MNSLIFETKNKRLQNRLFSPRKVVRETGKENVITDRARYIGGSDIPVIMGIEKRFGNAYHLALRKAGLVPYVNKKSIFTEYGDLYEPYIREYVNSKYNTNFFPACYIVSNFRANTDGFDPMSDFILEVKTNSGKSSFFKKYYVQMLFYMALYNRREGILAEYSREEGIPGTRFPFAESLPSDYSVNFDTERVKITKVRYDNILVGRIFAEIEKFTHKVELMKQGKITTEQEFNDYDKPRLF